MLGDQVQDVQFGPMGTCRRDGKDFQCARLCGGNERQRELICFANALAMHIFEGGSIGPPRKWYSALPPKGCLVIDIRGTLFRCLPFALW